MENRVIGSYTLRIVGYNVFDHKRHVTYKKNGDIVAWSINGKLTYFPHLRLHEKLTREQALRCERKHFANVQFSKLPRERIIAIGGFDWE